MNGVKRGVGTFHRQRSIRGNQQNVRLVTAVLLVQGLALRWEFEGLTARDLFQEDNCICNPALRADDEAFQIMCFMRFRVANLGIFADGQAWEVRSRPRPFDGAGDLAAVLDCDYLITLAAGTRPRNSEYCSREHDPKTSHGSNLQKPSPRRIAA